MVIRAVSHLSRNALILHAGDLDPMDISMTLLKGFIMVVIVVVVVVIKMMIVLMITTVIVVVVQGIRWASL